MEGFERPCCIRGHHIYKDIWEAAIGEHLACEGENANNHDHYAVAVLKDRTIVGHLPRKVSRVCSLFLRRGGRIDCVVTGTWRYSPQGGLEVPCKLLFSAKTEEIKKIRRLFGKS